MSRYTLEPYKGKKSRHKCPNCHKPFEFVRYIDTETGQYLADYVGRCNRENKCGYHLTPRQYFQENPQARPEPQNGQHGPRNGVVSGVPKPSYIPLRMMKKSLVRYDQNHFVKWLSTLFNIEITKALIKRFQIGTSGKWPGGTIFWQIDSAGHIRTGKIMLYNPETGKRFHSRFDWAHAILKKTGLVPEFNLNQCLFGLHQIRMEPKSKPIAIVESEKTAIIASVFLPGFIWLASGGSKGLNDDKFQAIAGRKVILWPDLGLYENWSQKASELENRWGGKVTVADILEKKAAKSDQKNGLDLADYLVKPDPEFKWALNDAGYPVFWDIQS